MTKFVKPKLLFLLIAMFFFFPLWGNEVWAADLEVTCGADGCFSTGDKPLFSETDVFPGWSKTKVVKAINAYDEKAIFATKVTSLVSVGGLSDILTVTIKKSGAVTNIYENNLTNLKNYGYLPLSIITGNSQEYDFTIKMQESAGNEYQALNALFDLSLGFEVSSIDAVPTTTSSSENCTASTPSAPSNLIATAISASVINLSWTAPSETITHYSISYGLNPGAYIYGNSNVGNVNTYTVSELSSGTTYYFIVYSVNDCAVSGASNEANATTTGVLGAFIAENAATNFQILGEKTPGELGEAAATQITEAGKVEGEKTKAICWWWLILSLLELIILSAYYWLTRKKESLQKYWLIISLVLAILAFVGDHFIAHRYLIPSRFCHWMWLWVILAALIPKLASILLKKNKI